MDKNTISTIHLNIAVVLQVKAARVNVRGAGGEGEDQEKVFHCIHFLIMSCSVVARACALVLLDTRTSKTLAFGPALIGGLGIGVSSAHRCCSRPLNSM